MSLVKNYLDLFESYKKEYGPKLVVLMQVGAFFEVYGLKNAAGETIRTNIDEFARLYLVFFIMVASDLVIICAHSMYALS